MGFRVYECAESLTRLGSAFCYGKESVLPSDSQRVQDPSKVKDHGSPLVGPRFAFPAKPGELLGTAILRHQPLLRVEGKALRVVVLSPAPCDPLLPRLYQTQYTWDRTEWAEQEGHRNFLTSTEMSKLTLDMLRTVSPSWALSPGRLREQASQRALS